MQRMKLSIEILNVLSIEDNLKLSSHSFSKHLLVPIIITA